MEAEAAWKLRAEMAPYADLQAPGTAGHVKPGGGVPQSSLVFDSEPVP